MNLAVDLGSSNFRVGMSGYEDIICEPCVVAYDQSGQYIVGADAERMLGRNPDMMEVLFPVQNGNVKYLDAAVEVLKYSVKRFVSNGFARRFNLTLSVPAGITQVEKRALEEAGRLAGARQVTFYDSLVAAANGAGLPIDKPIGCLVVNLGAGVTEAAVLSLNGVVDTRRITSGGQAVDATIVELLRKEYSFLIGIKSAELLKRRCSAEPNEERFDVRGRNLVTGLPDQLSVPRTLIDEQLNSYYQMIISLIVETLETCPPELVGDIMERGIVLVGGGANIADIVSQLSNRTEVPVIVAQEPDTCVIRGLLSATQAAGGRAARLKQRRLNETDGEESQPLMKRIQQLMNRV